MVTSQRINGTIARPRFNPQCARSIAYVHCLDESRILSFTLSRSHTIVYLLRISYLYVNEHEKIMTKALRYVNAETLRASPSPVQEAPQDAMIYEPSLSL